MLAHDNNNATTEFLKQKYQFRANNHKFVFEEYDRRMGFGALHEKAKLVFDDKCLPSTKEVVDHACLFRRQLDKDSVKEFAKYFKSTSKESRKFSDYYPLLKRILSPEIDAAIKNYLGSNYAVMWCSWYVSQQPDTDQAYLNKWHCDAGPTTHLKTITYFDNSEDHGSGTAIASLKATEELKEVGYALNDIRTRQPDISDITEHFGIDLGQEILQFEAGDTLIFNPIMRMHRVELPKKGAQRCAFSLGFAPSILPWDTVIEKGLIPNTENVPFETFVRDLMAITTSTPDHKLAPAGESDMSGIVVPIATQSAQDTIFLDASGKIDSPFSLEQHLIHIFKDRPYALKIKSSILASTGPKPNFTIKELLAKLKASFQRDLKWEGFFNPTDLQNVQSLLAYEENYLSTKNAYLPNGKPNPDAIMWPMPDHEKYPRNKYNMQPFVQKHKILDKTTPIASAGSCFAYEIAKKFQAEGFNYVVEEPPGNKAEGMFVDHYKEGDVYAPSSANYGILFNTPSLLQLAQKAFGVKPFPKICAELQPGIFCDPYRENVYFTSLEAYELDYPKHLEAIKRVLTKAKVFIFTAGLNECWQMDDGTVISRNPKPSVQHLLKHRVLSVQENIDNLKGFVEIVRRYNPDIKVVLTLSPVPLLATGRANTHHIIEANTHSKAVLRVALDEVVRTTPGVYYLPSYEMVSECVEDAWLGDHRHVKPETVDKVIAMFKEMFVEEV